MSPESSSAPTTEAATIDTELQHATAALERIDSPHLDAGLLMAHALDTPRGRLLAQGDRQLTPAERERFRTLVRRRIAGEPLAYITGVKEFWSLTLEVGPAVLVPRPATELLVEWALSLPLPEDARIADLGTGSGALAIALACERPRWRVRAADVSPAALEVAIRNAARLVPGRIDFHCGSWCDALPAGERFALIVSNPPYIATLDPALRTPELQAEPPAALVSGADGLDALRAIVAGAAGRLTTGGWLLLEHGAGQAHALAKLLEDEGYAHVRCRTDLAGFDRATLAQR